MPRSVAEWIADHDDQAIPGRVKLRVLDRQRPEPNALPICPDCGQPIRPGQAVHFDHGTPLADGGKHAESNLRAIHERPCHRIKTAREAMSRAEARTRQKSSYGIKQPKGRPLPGTKRSGIRKRMNGDVERWS